MLSQQQQVQLMPKPCFLTPFSNKKNQNVLEIQLILRLGQKIYKTTLEHIVIPDSSGKKKKVIKQQQQRSEEDMSNVDRSLQKGLAVTKAGTLWATKYKKQYFEF